MKFGDLAIFAKVGWEILEIRLRYSYLAPVSILFRLQTGAVHENESHCAIHFRGTTPGSDGQAFYCAQSEILPVKLDREKDVPGLFHRLLFPDSAKKKITCGVGIDANPGSTQGHFNRENLRVRYRASIRNLFSRENSE